MLTVSAVPRAFRRWQGAKFVEHSAMRKFKLSVLIACLAALPGAAEELPLVFADDFSGGVESWAPTDARAWKITKVDGNPVYENLGGSKYEPPFRSPKNISLRKDHVVSDFVLTARVQSKQKPRDHRDMCLFFGYQDPANFYYVHLGQKTDPHANQIFLVNEAPRVAISEKASDGTPWKSDTWHEVKIVRKVASGLIEIYFDDMETPTHVAHDKTFTWGQIGIGTFDDLGLWDDVELRGTVVEAPKQAQADPKQLKFEKWTPDFPVPDPVAISFDPQGRAYVTQTQRRKANDLDIRQNMDWLLDDLRFTSPEDKENFYREQFTPENSEANKKRVEDHNGDGIHDIKDLTALSEKVHLITDEDGDGFADSIYTYAEQLDHLIGGVAGGVLFHEGDVFVSPVPELVRFRDTNGDNQADEREVIASGFGVHLAYAGHDMHGLFIGPDGRVYWSIGDKGIRVKTADGLDYRFPNQGGLMRCELDGSNFEVFAHGLRNIQEVSFDQFGNFFGVDNDADYGGERERLVHIEQYADIGWRANWQYLREGYNPWMDEIMTIPWQKDQPRWFSPTLKNYENGPAGFKFNPGTALGPDYQNYFFLTSAPAGQQWAFQIKPSGDSFAMINDHKIGEGVPLVGLNFAPDGALYGVDWGGGYPLNQGGAVWRIDVPEEKRNPDRAITKELIGADFSKKESRALQELLGHADQRVRLKAQFALVKREELDSLASVATDVALPTLPRIHALWGMGQLHRGAKTDSNRELLRDPDPEVRAQWIRTFTDPFGRRLGLDRVSGPAGENSLTKDLIPALEDPSQRVRIQALLGLGRLGDSFATGSILKLLARKEHHVGMTGLRHAAIQALAGAATTEQLSALKDHKSDFVRACAVIALRRRGDEAVALFLSDADPITAADAARAIHDDWTIPEAMPALAAALGKNRENEALTRRAINANFRLGTPEAAARVTDFVAQGQAEVGLLEAGLKALQNWTKPGELDLVVGRYRPLEPRNLSILADEIKIYLDALLTSDHSVVRSTAMELARASELTIPNSTLVAVLDNREASPALRAEALRTLASRKAPVAEAVISKSLSDGEDLVKITALDLLAERDPAASAKEIGARVKGESSLPVKQHAVRTLAQAEGKATLKGLVADLLSGTLEPALHLDVIETAKAPAFAGEADIFKKVSDLESQWQAALATDPLAPFLVAIEGGDAKRGESVFMNHAAAQCIRCHKVKDGKGSNVGPNLKEIGKKKDAKYILESLVDPQKVIAQGYGNIALTLKDGTSLAGQFRKEENGQVVIRDPENRETKVPVDSIKERSPVVSTMPPMGYLLQKSELRDVVAYLRSLGK
jgi:putative membrane-bound dehydrogenase-like protein